MARRINLLVAPWNYYWPDRSAVTCLSQTGPLLVKDQIAEAAIKAGVAIEFDPVTKPATKRRASARKGRAPNARQPARMDREDMAAADRADGGATVDDAG